MNIVQQSKNFWEKCHKEANLESLSGCTYDQVTKFLHIENLIQPNKTVLEFGIGLCYITKTLKEKGLLVSALDISEEALRNAQQYCEHTYSVDTVHTLPKNYFDIIICQNTIQHIPTEVLKLEFKHCIAALKIGGVFAIQFVSADNIADTGVNAGIEQIKSGILCRSPQFIHSLVKENNGSVHVIMSAYGLKTNSIITGSHVFHIRRTS